MTEASNSEENYVVSILEDLQEFEDEILAQKESIKLVLEEQFTKHPTNTNRDELLDALSDTLYVEIEDIKKAEKLSRELYQFLILMTSDDRDKYVESSISDEMKDFLLELRNRYQLDATSLYLRNNQGRHHWSDIQTDYVIREPDERVGMNHTIEISSEKEIELSTSIVSNLHLVRNLLESQSRAHEIFGPAALDQVEEDVLDSISELIGEIQQKAEEE